MKLLFTLLTLTGFVTSWCQETLKKTHENESPPYKETYHVLKDNQEVKHGDYKKSYRGYSIKGRYEHGERAGIWEFTGQDGKLVQKVDFTNNLVTNLKSGEVAEKCMMWDGKEFKDVKPEDAPVFLGGKSWFAYYLWTSLRYPADAEGVG